VEGQAGVVEGDLARQTGECGMRDIRGVRNDYVELAGYRRSPISDKETGALGEAERLGIAPRAHRGARGDVEAKPDRSREFGEERQQNAAGSGAEIEEVKGRLSIETGTQHGFDDRFGFRPRIEGVG